MIRASVPSDVSEVIHSIAALAWPAVAALFLYLFRQDIANVLSRIRRAKVPGLDVELDKELDDLRERTEHAAEGLPADPSAGEAENDDLWKSVVVQIVNDATKSPVAALIGLSAAIERESREVLSSSAGEEGPRVWRAPLVQQVDRLDLSPGLREAADEFRLVRNKIVHGQSASNEEALRAVDIGIELLGAIQRIPREVHRVVAAGLPCFADQTGKSPLDFTAVLLASANSARPEVVEERAFPTTEPDRFPDAGEVVSWEWGSGGRIFPETWYRHPEGDVRYGWTSALEFRGRALH